MRLVELEPEWLYVDPAGDGRIWRRVPTRAEANGLFLLCPVCFAKNDGRVGTHAIICWEPAVPLTFEPGPGRWNLVGDSFDTLTLQAGSSSILLQSGCNAHFFIRNGAIEGC